VVLAQAGVLGAQTVHVPFEQVGVALGQSVEVEQPQVCVVDRQTGVVPEQAEPLFTHVPALHTCGLLPLQRVSPGVHATQLLLRQMGAVLDVQSPFTTHATQAPDAAQCGVAVGH